MKKATKKSHFFPLRHKLLAVVVISASLSSLLLGIIAYFSTGTLMMEKEKQTAIQSLTLVQQQFENMIREAESLSGMITNDSAVQSSLRRNFFNRAEQYSYDLEITSQINKISVFQNYIDSFSIIGHNGLLSNSKPYTFNRDSYFYEDWYANLFSANRAVWYPVHEGSFAVTTLLHDNYISYGIPVNNLATGNAMGILLIDIKENTVAQILNDSVGPNNIQCLLDSGRNPILWSGSLPYEDIAQRTDSLSDNMLAPDQTVFAASNASGEYVISTRLTNGWTLVNIIPEADLLASSIRTGITLLLAIAVISFCFYLISRRVTRAITQPITVMTEKMHLVEQGDFSIQMPIEGNDELSVLSSSFNLMIEKINLLVEEGYKKNLELQKTELKALQAQINPHFLYNTMESISWLARDHRDDDVVKIILALTTFFRLGLSSGKEVISVQDEINHAASYVSIQLFRYSNKLDYTIQIDETLQNSLTQYQTVKLILQPIIENAIYHGIKPQQKFGHIHIHIKDGGNTILFEVQDNGKGMDAWQLDSLNKSIQSSESLSKSYGLKNVDSRIKLYFGQAYGLSFRSQQNAGTIVTITIPKIQGVKPC